MRRYSKGYILVNGEKFYLISIKDEYSSRYDPVGFIKKSDKKDEFGIVPEGDNFLKCPHRNTLPSSRMMWTPLPCTWLYVRDECQKCWGSHLTPQSEFNCILRSFQIKQYKNGEAMGISKRVA